MLWIVEYTDAFGAWWGSLTASPLTFPCACLKRWGRNYLFRTVRACRNPGTGKCASLEFSMQDGLTVFYTRLSQDAPLFY